MPSTSVMFIPASRWKPRWAARHRPTPCRESTADPNHEPGGPRRAAAVPAALAAVAHDASAGLRGEAQQLRVVGRGAATIPKVRVARRRRTRPALHLRHRGPGPLGDEARARRRPRQTCPPDCRNASNRPFATYASASAAEPMLRDTRIALRIDGRGSRRPARRAPATGRSRPGTSLSDAWTATPPRHAGPPTAAENVSPRIGSWTTPTVGTRPRRGR